MQAPHHNHFGIKVSNPTPETGGFSRTGMNGM